jgi:hypothetical protein
LSRLASFPPRRDRFASWAAQGWTLGTLTSVHINVDLPVANVTTTSK